MVWIEDRREDLLAVVHATRKILRKKVQLTLGIDNLNLVKHDSIKQHRSVSINANKRIVLVLLRHISSKSSRQ